MLSQSGQRNKRVFGAGGGRRSPLARVDLVLWGVPLAMAALAGILAAPLLLVVSLALIYAQFASRPEVAGALRGMGAVAAGLIGSTAFKLTQALKSNVLGWHWCASFGLASLVTIAAFRVPLVYVIFGVGGLACALAYRKLQP